MSTTELLSEIRELEDTVDSLKSVIQQFDKFLTGRNVTSDVEDREISKLQELINDCLEEDEEYEE
jgi:chromosome segregation ATPase